jgi:hypothetical protein
MVLKNSRTRRKWSLPLASKQVQNTSYTLIRLCSKDGCYRTDDFKLKTSEYFARL